MTGILATIIDRMLKKGAGWLGRSPCSRNARLEKALVGRAQLGSSQHLLLSDSSLRPCLG
jgi:hypothetical protein